MYMPRCSSLNFEIQAFRWIFYKILYLERRSEEEPEKMRTE